MTSEAFETAAYAQRSVAEDGRALKLRLEALCPWYATFLRPWLPRDKKARILDLPCGAGNLLFALRSLGYSNVVGVDMDPGQVALAVRLGLPAQVGDAFEVLQRAPRESTHRVFSLDFLEHVTPEDAVRFCRLAHDALVDGGSLICRTPSADGPFASHDRYNDMTHKWAVTANAASQLMAMAGFRASKVGVLDEGPVPYSWRNVLRRAAFLATTTVVGAWLDIAGIGAPTIWTRSMWIVATR